jgi:hypothetical protein
MKRKTQCRRTSIFKRKRTKRRHMMGGMDPPIKKAKTSASSFSSLLPQAAAGGASAEIVFIELNLKDLEKVSGSVIRFKNIFRFLGKTYDTLTSSSSGIKKDIDKIHLIMVRHNFHYSGVIPSAISKFQRLREFRAFGTDLATIQIKGELPQEMCDLQYLSDLSCDIDIQPAGKFMYPNFPSLEDLVLKLHPVQSEGKTSVSDLLNDLATADRQTRLTTIHVTAGFNPTETETILFDEGRIPSTIENLTSLEALVINRVNLTGSLPGQISGLQYLRNMDLANNHLTGELPASIGALTSLSTLNISNNDFSGELPLAIGGLTALRFLNVTNNNFEGILPDLSGLTNLQTLQLSQNSFTELKAAANTIFRRNPPFMLEIRQRENPQLWFDGFLCFFKEACERRAEEDGVVGSVVPIRPHIDIIEEDIEQLYHYLAICREANGFHPPHEPGEELLLRSLLDGIEQDGYNDRKTELLLQMYEFVSHNYYDLK